VSGIFISYRREDSAPYAGRLYDRLCAHFGGARVFMDVDDIPPGADFVAHIEATVGACDAMLAVIGKNWLTARNPDGQLRLSDPSDYVGLEISQALQRNILVIPTLVNGAAMPQARDLPRELRELAQRNAIVLDDHDFQRDTQPLIHTLETIPGLNRGLPLSDSTKTRQISTGWRKRWIAPLALLLATAGLWWHWNQGGDELPGGRSSGGVDAVTAAVAGRWEGDVTYGWGPTHAEEFFFQMEGQKLFGTASFLGFKRGIENGQIEGDRISFSVRYQEVLGATTTERMNRYTGRVSDNQIRFRIQDDKGSPPVEFVARKSEVAG
jgi:hypothetical protein